MQCSGLLEITGSMNMIMQLVETLDYLALRFEIGEKVELSWRGEILKQNVPHCNYIGQAKVAQSVISRDWGIQPPASFNVGSMI